MDAPNKNNPDGQGSYGRSPSRFKARPQEKADDRSNDATADPMGHVGLRQEDFDEAQRQQAGGRAKSKAVKRGRVPPKT